MVEKLPPDSSSAEREDNLLDLEASKEKNHFEDTNTEEIHITGDSKNREHVTNKCRHTLALCELFDIKPEMIGIHGTLPVVYVDIHPSRNSGQGGKYGIIEYRKEEVVMEDGVPKLKDCEKFVADFDITVWDIPAEKKVSGIGSFTKTRWELRL